MKLGGPCQRCGKPQIERASGCTRSQQECPYGKFDAPEKPHVELARAMGLLAATLCQWETKIAALEQRVARLEQERP